MPVDPKQIVERLIERNPGADPEDLQAAFVEQAQADPALMKAVARDVASRLLDELEAAGKVRFKK
jgi:hypothetical protein